MGQRHQIYMRLPNNNVIGIHHQWLYGTMAVILLKKLLIFFEKNIKGIIEYHLKYNAKELLKSCYSFNADIGYYHNVISLYDNVNPYYEDNNDGITVIDCKDINNITYCFCSISGIETATRQPNKNIPLSITDWLWAYDYYDTYKQYTKENYALMSQETLNEIIVKWKDVK